MMYAVLAAVSQRDLAGPLLGPVGFVVAFFIGTVSFFSPCILPLVPGYLSYVSGLTGESVDAAGGRKRVLLGSALFVLGFATMYTALGATGAIVGSFLIEHLTVINRVAGALIVLMGIAFLFPRLVPFVEREGRPFMRFARPGLAGAYPLGLAFAAGWTACIGPGLGFMLTLAAEAGSVGRGALLLFFFSLGFGAWFLLAALGMRRALTASSWIRKHARSLQLVGGTFMVVIGVLLVLDQWNTVIGPLRRWSNRFAPPV